MLEIERPPLTNQPFSEWNQTHLDEAADQLAPDAAFNPEAYFDRWFADVNAMNPQVFAETPEANEIYFESTIGSTCEVNFEGVMYFAGQTMGNIRSPEGTLVLAKKGRVDADIDVGTAMINGSVTGNINAPEGVILDRDARVVGHIHTRMLTVNEGAIFEGDCLFPANGDSLTVEQSPGVAPGSSLAIASLAHDEADIDVGTAVISGSMVGNISAPEGVILDSDARVVGQIHTRMLTVRVGALFEGDCSFAAVA